MSPFTSMAKFQNALKQLSAEEMRLFLEQSGHALEKDGLVFPRHMTFCNRDRY